MSWYRRIKRVFMKFIWDNTLTCAELTRYSSETLDRRIPLTTRLKMRVHFRMCRMCRRYFDQIQYIREHSKDLDAHADCGCRESLSPECKERIRDSIRDEIHPDPQEPRK